MSMTCELRARNMNAQLCKADLLPPSNWLLRGGLLIGILGLALLGACAQQPSRNTGAIVSMVVLPKEATGTSARSWCGPSVVAKRCS